MNPSVLLSEVEKIFNYFLRGKLKIYPLHLILNFAHKPQGGQEDYRPPPVYAPDAHPALNGRVLKINKLLLQNMLIFACLGRGRGKCYLKLKPLTVDVFL